MSENKEIQKKKRWFLDGVLLNKQENPNEGIGDLNEDITENPREEIEIEQNEIKNDVLPVNKTNDKLTLDIITAVNNLIDERQLTQIKLIDLEQQLLNATEYNEQLKNNLKKKEQIILTRDDEVSKLRDRLSQKQMSYDQLLEDYQDYQSKASKEYDTIRNALEKEQNKYQILEKDYNNSQLEHIQAKKELEDKIRELIADKKQLQDQYQGLIHEKSKLLDSVHEFTKRISISNKNFSE